MLVIMSSTFNSFFVFIYYLISYLYEEQGFGLELKKENIVFLLLYMFFNKFWENS